ncbi:MAG: class II fructose-bisphosphatase, partial [candidate division Zixibacteria bacterium]|nr:class II fructose-bisphosphatase [candidate division Zixibacteria bacterium]
MDRNLGLELMRVTEAAALACARWMGKGDAHQADDAAVEAMRKAFSAIQFSGVVVIGEGERDEAPMLFIGEKLGNGKPPRVDIALDPLECTNSVAFGRSNALSVVAAAEHGHFLHAPDTYMEKIAVGKEAQEAIDLSKSVEENLKNIADAKQLPVENLTVVVLDRQRHEELVKRVRKLGCRIQLIPDGDVSAAIATALPDSGVDVLLGTGGAPEGVLAAAALRCLGGGFQGKLTFRNEEEIKRAKRMGIKNVNKIYSCE